MYNCQPTFQNEKAKDEFRSRDALIIYTSGTTGEPKVCYQTSLLGLMFILQYGVQRSCGVVRQFYQ